MTSLREFHKVADKNSQTIKVGDVVLVHDDTPQVDWRMAVIEELITGNDGLVRAAKIRTAKRRTNRPITKLVSLERYDSLRQQNLLAVQTLKRTLMVLVKIKDVHKDWQLEEKENGSLIGQVG